MSIQAFGLMLVFIMAVAVLGIRKALSRGWYR